MRAGNQSRSQRTPKDRTSNGSAQRPGERCRRCEQSSQSCRAALNMAQRVMDCGDAGHILLSKHVAEDLEEYEQWRPLLHDLGSCEVKHGVRVSVVNLYDDQFGNAKLPQKFETVQKRRTRLRWAAMTAALLTLAAIVVGIAMFSRNRVRSTLAAPEKSIAVLPFENRSEGKANE